MAGKSPVTASDEQRSALESLAASRERGEADRARAMLLTLNGWTSARIAEAFGVREDTVRLWRELFHAGRRRGTESKRGARAFTDENQGRASRYYAVARCPGCQPAQLDDPASHGRNREARRRQNRTLAAFQSASQKRGFRWRRPRHTLKGRQDADEIGRVGLRLRLRRQQAEAGDIVLLYADESEALTHPYLARGEFGQGVEPICGFQRLGKQKRLP